MKTKTPTPTTSKEGEYPRPNSSFYGLLDEVLKAEKPIHALLESLVFLCEGRRTCCRITGSNKDYAEDLFQEACIRILKYYAGALTPDKIRSESDFWGWFFTLARNIYRSERRKNRLKYDDKPSDEHQIPDDGIDVERDRRIHEFEEYCKLLPEDRQLALRMWLEGYSYREIEKELKKIGVSGTYVTVRSRVRKAIKNFLDSQADR